MKTPKETHRPSKLEASIARLEVGAKKALERLDMLRRDASKKVALYEKAAKTVLREAKAEKKRSSPAAGAPTAAGESGMTSHARKPSAKNSVSTRSPHKADAAKARPAGGKKSAKTTATPTRSVGQSFNEPSLEGHRIDGQTPSAIDLPGLDETLDL